MYKISLGDNKINFKDLEKNIYKYACNFACDMMKNVLEKLDDKLMAKRDTESLRDKGKRHTCIKTIMGDIEIDRRIYEYKIAGGKKAYKYLLDEFLGIETIGHMSMNLVEDVISNATEVSYRKSADNVKLMCNEEISHTAVWNVIQKVGSKIKEIDDRKIKLNKQGKLHGKKEVKVLFQEQDGLWLNIQGQKKLKGSNKNRKKELKLGISYEGWKKRKGSKDEYTVSNKLACASFEGSKKFCNLYNAAISETYDVDEINTIILNGDGASWIKMSAEYDNVYFQLDPFHKSQAVIRNVPNKKEARKLIRLLNSGKVKESFNMIVKMLERDNLDKGKFEKLKKLYNYLVQNKKGLIPYYLRKNINLPHLPEGLVYRHLGTMEHNICDILVQRMKGRKMSWSIKGAENLAKILALKFTNKLYEVLDEIYSNIIVNDKFKEIKEVAVLSAGKLKNNNKNSKIANIRRCNLPFEGCALTNGRKAIRNMLENQIL